MAEKPILCTAQVVRNLLDGKQTQDRRPIRHIGNCMHHGKILGSWGLSEPPCQYDGEERLWRWQGKALPQKGDWIWSLQTDVDDEAVFPLKSPYSVGDHLYVRETWCPGDAIFHKGTGEPAVVRYKADGPPIPGMWDDIKWRPSIHMPKWATRIWLEVLNVRAERIQEISDADCIAEGMDPELRPGYGLRYAFGSLWESLYPDSWSRNDFVWVYDLRRIER